MTYRSNRPPALALVAALAAACAPNATPNPNQGDPMTQTRTETSAAEARPSSSASKTITFHPDRVYEVTGIWIRPGQAEAMQSYFGRVFPIAAEHYGVRPLFGLEPVNVYAGDFRPDMMFVNEWPSLEAFQGFISDERATALFPERDAAASRIVVTQYRVPQEATVELRENDVVEFGAMWMKPGRQDDFRSYYERVVPIARRNGMRPITRLSPVFSYRGDFSPSGAGLNWWGTLESFQRFAQEASSHFPERDATLERLEVTHARVHLHGEG